MTFKSIKVMEESKANIYMMGIRCSLARIRDHRSRTAELRHIRKYQRASFIRWEQKNGRKIPGNFYRHVV